MSIRISFLFILLLSLVTLKAKAASCPGDYPVSFGCSAQDIIVTNSTVTEKPANCLVGTSFTGRVEVTLGGTTNAERYQVGLYILSQGADIKASGNSCQLTVAPTTSPFTDAEAGANACGDITGQGINPPNAGTLPLDWDVALQSIACNPVPGGVGMQVLVDYTPNSGIQCGPYIPDGSSKCYSGNQVVAVEPLGRVVIKKTADPDDGNPFSFAYTSTDPAVSLGGIGSAYPANPSSPFAISDGGSQEIYVNLEDSSASLTITETLRDGYLLDTVSCINSSDSSTIATSVSGSSFTVEVTDQAPDIECTVTNRLLIDYSDAPASYGDAPTAIYSSIYLGATAPDSETSGSYSYQALGDGLEEDGAPQSQTGINLFPVLIDTDSSYAAPITVNNGSGGAATLEGWIDFDQSGTFDADEKTTVAVPNGTSGVVSLNWPSLPSDLTKGTTFVRLRLINDLTGAGEVEDHVISIATPFPPESPLVSVITGEPPRSCQAVVFTDNFDDLTGDGYLSPSRSDSVVVRDWIATGGGEDTYARTLSQGVGDTAIYLGNGMVRRISPSLTDLGGLSFDANGRLSSIINAIELRTEPDDITPGIMDWQSLWGPEEVTFSRSFSSEIGKKYRLYFTATPESGSYVDGMMRIDTPVGSAHFRAPASGSADINYAVEFTAVSVNSTISFANYGHIGPSADGWCNPQETTDLAAAAWCTQDGTSDGTATNEIVFDDIFLVEALCDADYSDGPINGGVAPDGVSTLAYGEATHSVISGIQLGATITFETSAIEDADNVSDDGINLPNLTAGDSSYTISTSDISAIGSGTLHAWIDFDGNGTFDSDEHSSTTVTSGAPATALGWTIDGAGGNPDFTVTKGVDIYARFRLTSDTLTNSDSATAASDGEVEDYLITIDPGGVVVSGNVYIDDNRTQTRQSDEVGIGNTVVVLRDVLSGTCQSATTLSNGDYRFTEVLGDVLGVDYEIYQAHGESTPIPASCDSSLANNPTGYNSTTADVINITVIDSDITEQNFGEIWETSATNPENVGTGLTFEPNHQSEVLPGNTAFYAHVLTSEAGGNVSFSSSASGNIVNGWTHLLYRDDNCNGVLDAVEANTLLGAGSFALAAGDSLCIINKVYAPANTPAQDLYEVTTTALVAFDFSAGLIPSATLTVTDITTAGQTAESSTTTVPSEGESRLELIKKVKNMTQDTAETTTINQASPNDVLRYRIYYQNTGIGPINDLKINDIRPPLTGFVSGSNVCDMTPAGMTCTANVSLDFYDLSWEFTGTLLGGAGGHVSYQVRVDN